jgi:GNAT superfamily N-acetyltransferase
MPLSPMMSGAFCCKGYWMIRIGTPDDFAAIDAFDPFAGDRREELAAGRVLVSETDGQVVGYTTFSQAGFIGRSFVHFLAVVPEHRRQGVAIALLRAVERSVGRGRLFASTEEGNAVMLRLLDRDGWTPAGCVRGVNDDGSAECFFYREVTGAAVDPAS